MTSYELDEDVARRGRIANALVGKVMGVEVVGTNVEGCCGEFTANGRDALICATATEPPTFASFDGSGRQLHSVLFRTGPDRGRVDQLVNKIKQKSSVGKPDWTRDLYLWHVAEVTRGRGVVKFTAAVTVGSQENPYEIFESERGWVSVIELSA